LSRSLTKQKPKARNPDLPSRSKPRNNLKAVFAILFSVLLVITQGVTSNAAAGPGASECACSCGKQCCVKPTQAPGSPTSTAPPASMIKRVQLALPQLVAPSLLDKC